MLQKVAQHPGNGWLWLLQLILSGRAIFLLVVISAVLMERSSEIVLLMVLLKIYFY